MVTRDNPEARLTRVMPPRPSCQILTELLAEPVQVGDVVIGHHPPKLDFDRDDALIRSLDDEIDLLPTLSGAEVSDARFDRLRRHANGERHQ